jgi:antitoxin CptB
MDENSSLGLEARRRRLRFRCWHRGTRELDLMFGRFADAQLATLSEAEIGEFERWLEVPDPQMFNYVNGAETPPAALDSALFKRLLAFHRSGRK